MATDVENGSVHGASSARIAPPNRRLLGAGLAAYLVLLVIVYFSTFRSMADKWMDEKRRKSLR